MLCVFTAEGRDLGTLEGKWAAASRPVTHNTPVFKGFPGLNVHGHPHSLLIIH